ncbi:15-hydroxyprostaglandin dehydrogenase [NAD(+)]-like [Littorina saxatilis]|uniref:15-hydroxyprostaglandin dehydrogenase [NAD(+)] n=1 Tax=Littorina saxatilis TaxID=31220 RepID=A0AAN9GP90_9CAEN
MQLKGKTALVTGGASGVGLAVIETLASKGTKAVSLDVSEEAGQTAAAVTNDKYGAGSVTFIKCDVTHVEQLESCFKQAVSVLGHIDIVFNNAGVILENRWEYMIDVNFKGVVAGTQLAVEHMRRDKGGKGGVIINTSSYVGLVPKFTHPVYVGSKFAVVGFTSSWASNPYMKDMGLRFGTLCPTAVDTAFHQLKDEQVRYPREFRESVKMQTLLPVPRAVEGFLQLVEDDESNGSNLMVMAQGNLYQQQVLQDGKGLPKPQFYFFPS